MDDLQCVRGEVWRHLQSVRAGSTTVNFGAQHVLLVYAVFYVQYLLVVGPALCTLDRFVWGRPIVVISDPEAFKQVFVTNSKSYKKDTWSYKIFKCVLCTLSFLHYLGGRRAVAYRVQLCPTAASLARES